MSSKSGFESRESHSLTQQVAVSSKSEVRQCWLHWFVPVFVVSVPSRGTVCFQVLASKSPAAVSTLNAEGESALHEACLSDRPQNVEQLLRCGIDPTATQSHRYPIHCAASVSSVR